MSALTASVDDAAVDYVHQPTNFGEDTWGVRTAEVDAFRAGAAWAEKHIDWRVLAGSVPGRVFAGILRLGDRVSVADVEGVVISLSKDHAWVRFTLRTDPGAEIVFERPRAESVMVLAAGRAS